MDTAFRARTWTVLCFVGLWLDLGLGLGLRCEEGDPLAVQAGEGLATLHLSVQWAGRLTRPLPFPKVLLPFLVLRFQWPH